MAGLRHAKQRMIALFEQREEILREADREIRERRAEAPAAARAGAARDMVLLEDEYERIPNAFERAADRLWAEYVPLLDIIRTAVGYAQTPPPIADYVALGAQVNYLDDLWNAVSQSMQRAGADAATANPVGPR